MKESRTETQVRLVLERQCRELVDVLKPRVPAGVGFILFLADFGDKGNLAYASTLERQSTIKLLQEWLDHEDDTYDVKRLRELLLVAYEVVQSVAKAVEFTGQVGDWNALVEHCKKLRESKK